MFTGVVKRPWAIAGLGGAGALLLALLVSWWWRGADLRTCELTLTVADQLAEQRDKTLTKGAEAARRAKAERDAVLKNDIRELHNEDSCHRPADDCALRALRLYEQRAVGTGGGAR